MSYFSFGVGIKDISNKSSDSIDCSEDDKLSDNDVKESENEEKES